MAATVQPRARLMSSRLRGDVIVVMAKTPVVGRVKTRLQADVGATTAVEVAVATLQDVVDQADVAADGVVVATAGDRSLMTELLPSGTAVRAQVGPDLAARLAQAQADAFAEGASRVVLLGADCPTVGSTLLRAALSGLDHVTAVLGPAADGGYTLLATSRPTPGLFAGIAMGRPDVADRTRAAAVRHGITLSAVAERHDLDTLDDLAAALAAGQLDEAPRTRALARSLLAARAG